jgi:hypothetical protein
MKFETVKSKGFEPITIQFTIETAEELDAIQEMCILDCSIPELVSDEGTSKYIIVQNFLTSLQKTLP